MTTLLYNKTSYNLLESTLTEQQLVEFAKSNNMKAIGICDTNVLFAVMNFYKLALANNIKPIIGLEVKVKIGENLYPYLIYPKNNEGYLSLIKISSKLCTGASYLELSDLDYLANNCKIIIHYHGYLFALLNNKQYQQAEQYLASLNASYYIGLPPNNTAFNKSYIIQVKDINQKANLPYIALKKAVMHDIKALEGYKTLIAIKNNTTVKDTRLVFEEDAYLNNSFQLSELFENSVLDNTDHFCDDINLQITEFKGSLPIYQTNSALNSKQYLRELCNVGLNKRLNNKVTNVYKKRLDYELDVICKMHFEDYFLIIYDLVAYARKNGIYIGPGRGSAVGSLVAYCLGITQADPIKYGLLFERFLNVERISMPDIDFDIPPEDRATLINYTKEKYGERCVSNIITFGTYATKAALNDVAKVHLIKDSIHSKLSAAVSKNLKLEELYETSKQFRTIVDSYDEAFKLYEIAKSIEGLPRTISLHASGVIISSKPLDNIIPVTNISNILATQYKAEHLEPLGLIKFDYLGLSNLADINAIFKDVFPKENVMSILKLNLNDKPTLDLIRRADTLGIFQLSEGAIKLACKKIKPTSFEELADVISIGRPGPSQYIDKYIENRANPHKIQYLHPDFKPILEKTYGIIIYQEQIMQLAVKIAGFSLNKADVLRKAISKKDADLMYSLKEEFIKGALQKGYQQLIAQETFDMIVKFAEYGFNKSHAIAYAMIAYQEAYFKANFPLNFYKHILSRAERNKLNECILECKKKGIKILPPDINYSEKTFAIKEQCLRFPLTYINDLDNPVVDKIIKEREENGLFTDYIELVARLLKVDNSDKTLKALINAGALDGFKLSHNTMLNGIEPIVQYAKICQVDNNGQQQFDFEIVSKPVLINYADNKDELLAAQYNALNCYLTNHPVEAYRPNFPQALYSHQIINYRGNLALLGLIINIKEHRTKNGEIMAFVSCVDEFGSFDVTLMPDLYNRFKETIRKGQIIFIEGSKSNYDSVKTNRLTIMKG